MDKKIRLIGIMGESGAGKDTLVNKMCLIYKGLNKVVSTTTRPIRDNETEGVDYFYIDEHEFAEKILNFEMLEATDFRDWFYGTELKSLDKTKINIGAYNPEGMRCLMEDSRIDLKVIHLRADDKVRIKRALDREENPDVSEIFRRFEADKKDFADIAFPHTAFVNNGDQTMPELAKCVGAVVIDHFIGQK